MQSTVPMMSTATGAKPWYIKKWPENMMSTPTGAAPWYISWTKVIPWGMSKIPATTPSKPTTTPTPSRTTASTVSSSVVDRNAQTETTTEWAPDIERGTTPPATTPEAEVPTTEAPTTPEVPTTTEWEQTPPDYVGQDIALTQAEYMQQSKEQEEFLRNQRSIQTQIDTLSGEMQQLQSSELIRKTSDDLDKLKHNIAYLGKQGQPWESAVKMEAISKQVADAERVFMNLKKLETDKESMRTLGLEYAANAFERQMVQMQNDLNANVNMAIQEALNWLNAAEMKGEIDTVEDVEKLRGTLFQNLDKAIAWKVVANATDRKLIIDRYNQVIAEWEAYVKNKSVVNKDLSTAMWYYIDGNGNPILNAQGGTIAVPKEAPMEPIFDKDSGNLLTFSTDANGKIVTTVQKVLAGTQAAGEPRKQASDGTYYRTNAQWQLETQWTAQGKQLTPTEKLARSKALNNWEITQEEYNAAVYWGWAPVWGTQGTPVSQYTWPAYTAASVEKVQAAFTQAVSQWDGARGGQCWAFVNDYLQNMGIGRLFKDPIDVKKAVMNSTEATVWSIAIMDSSSQPEYGHVGIVTSVNSDGTVTLKQSNKKWEEKVFTSKKNLSDIYGFFDPQIPMNEALVSAPTTVQWWELPNYTNETIAQALANYDISIQDIPWMWATSGNAKKQIIARAMQINPDFDTKTSKTRMDFMKKRTSWDLSINKIAVNTTLWHISTLADNLTTLWNTRFKPLNQVKNRLADITGNPNLASASVSAKAVATEIAKVFKWWAVSPTKEEIADWKDILTTKMSPAQRKWVLQNSAYLLSSRMRSLSDTYNVAMWKYPDLWEVLFPESQNTLQKLWINPNKFAWIGQWTTTTTTIDTSWIGRRQAAQQ